MAFVPWSIVLSAQNLVVNPGLEKSKTQQQSGLLSTTDAEGWSVPTKGTSDYIRPTSKERKEQAKDIPAYAHIIPYEGKACAGFHGAVGGYEYVCGLLTEPLKKDSAYTISFALATAFDLEFFPDRVGIYFTKEMNPKYSPDNGAKRIALNPQCNLAQAEVIAENGHWTVYSMRYVATGGENSFIIGDFTDRFQQGMQGKQADYFFIDSVSISHPAQDSLTHPWEGPMPASVSPRDIEIVNVPADTAVIAAGRTLIIENIYFETDKSRILPESYQPLYDIIVELKLQPNLKVEIVGHTDKHGNAADNQKLSEQRAQAVKDFFVSKGIDASRITTAGRGSSQPVGDDDQKNRRVEFRFYE